MPTTLKLAAPVAAALIAASCASGPDRPGGPAVAVSVGAQAERLLADARKRRDADGCASAIPSYRVVASFGKGHDTAQFELGECLLFAAKDAPDQDLLAEEGLFWLRRAAWAANPRAQLALAHGLSGTVALERYGLPRDLVEAYGWALIYEDNAAHALYGLPALNLAAADAFTSQMTPAEIDKGEAFAASYRKIEMDVFQPPAVEGRASRAEGARPPGAPEGRRRRPR
ncbi:MAG: hypothetical protein AAFW81_07610 [Pseudomonadota bacterium]